MISSSSSNVLYNFSVDLKLASEFTSLEEPADDSDLAADAVFTVDGSEFIRSERQIEPKDPMQKLMLPIVRSTS
jgi:hypothetical protein